MRYTGHRKTVNTNLLTGERITQALPAIVLLDTYLYRDETKEYAFHCYRKVDQILVYFPADTSYEEYPLERFLTQIIKEYHPAKLICPAAPRHSLPILSRNLFYPKGKDMQRIIEPWRYCISDKAFDPEGYIINQGLMASLPFGFFNTKDKGCGWISAYNLLKLCGKEKEMQEVARGLDSRAFFGEAMGQWVYTLYAYMKKQGLPVHMTHMAKVLCIQTMKKSSCGIFLYVHKRGSHYTTYRRIGENKFHFYNAVYGHANLETSAEEFMKQYTFLPVANLIWIE